MIETIDLNKTFFTKKTEIQAVQGLNIKVPKNSITGLFGPNGAGKTTTIRMISTIYQPSSGEAYVNGMSVHDKGLEIRQILGLSAEQPSLYKRLTGRRNLRFYAELYGVDKNEINYRIDNLATEFDLEEAIDRPVGGYSKGMKQKLSVAKALIHNPDILILDEPWSGLSPGATKELRDRIKALQEEHARTILISTHNLAQAEKIVDKIIIISKGKLIAIGTPEEIRSKFHIDNEVKLRIVGTFDEARLKDELSTNDSVLKYKILNDQTILVDIDSFDHTADLVTVFVNNKYRIREVEEVIPSLEEMYLNLVEVEQ